MSAPPQAGRARKSRSLGAFPMVSLLLLCAGFGAAGCQPSGLHQSAGQAKSGPSAPSPFSGGGSGGVAEAETTASKAASQPNDALALWRRTVDAPRLFPVRASVVVTRFNADSSPPTISRYEMVEALGGRKYRITYHAPASAAGRIVLCDGQTLWQYEPNHDTVLRRPIANASGAFTSASEAAADSAFSNQSDQSGANGKADALPAAVGLQLEAESDSVAGRATRVLALHGESGNGPVVERRWVDVRTGRTLRTEQYDKTGKKKRRVEMTQVAFSPVIEPGEFIPNLAEGVRIVDTTQKNPLPPQNMEETEATARSAGLPLRVKGFVLQSAAVTKTLGENTTHLVYSNGVATLSVFVTPTQSGSSGSPSQTDTAPVLEGAAGWKPAVLRGHRAGTRARAWTQETPSRTAVAWTQNRARLVAVAQIPLRDLLMVADALATNEPRQAAPRTKR